MNLEKRSYVYFLVSVEALKRSFTVGDSSNLQLVLTADQSVIMDRHLSSNYQTH